MLSKFRFRDKHPQSIRVIATAQEGPGRKLRTRMLLALVPSALVIIMAIGLTTYFISAEQITLALERSARQHAATTAHAVSALLERYREDLLYASRQSMDAQSLQRFLTDIRESRGSEHVEFGFIALKANEPLVIISQAGRQVRIPPGLVNDIRPSPLHLYEQLRTMGQGEVLVVDMQEVDYPFPSEENPHNRFAATVLRLATPLVSEQGEFAGYAYLAVDVRRIRDLLSLYDSEQSPVFAGPRNPALAYSYLYDRDGWVLFQSEPLPQSQTPLSTLSVRSRKQGTLGRPGMPSAFIPADTESRYWQMIQDTVQGVTGPLQDQSRKGWQMEGEYSLAYAPIRFTVTPDKAPVILGGVAVVDRGMFTVVAGSRPLHTMAAIVGLSVLVMILLLVLVAQGTARDFSSLAHSIRSMRTKGRLEEIRCRTRSDEAQVIQDTINAMIATIKDQAEEIRVKDLAIESVTLQEPADPAGDWKQRDGSSDLFPEIVGTGPLMAQLKRDLRKAGQVDADILIVGETGTGKQLAAEAIHRISRRSQRPFISVNCGELDESLLLDTLFGHIKGAYTDGKTDRKGAFLQAHGGILFLDEIQTSSPKVQQALLRAISMRKIKPLGSDQELDVDIRLITATNADLNELIQKQAFREDLYYRLKVITISLPPLRDHRENIPLLANYFLMEAEHMAGRQGLAFSKGFLDKLMQYHWPGNIRELKNSIVKAAVMAEGEIIQRDQLRVETGASEIRDVIRPAPTSPATPPAEAPVSMELNHRQVLAYKYVTRHGQINRKIYQSLLGSDVSRRTAIYDLQDMVSKGFLAKVSQGPTTGYVQPGKEGP